MYKHSALIGVAVLLSVGAGFSTELSKTVRGVGVVTNVDPQAGRLTINHEDIEDFMGAMEMSYPVVSAVLLRGLKPGDKVQFVIKRQNGTIVDLNVTDGEP
jgi:Cu/Ag efflux protein CusF